MSDRSVTMSAFFMMLMAFQTLAQCSMMDDIAKIKQAYLEARP